MKTIDKIIIGLVLTLFLSNCSTTNNTDKTVTIEINYVKSQSIQKESILWEEGMTALEALQYAATIETHPVAKYVFVSSINNVIADRGVTAWYYEINGEPSKTLAINKELKQGDVVRWILKKDVCSNKVCKNK